MKKFAHLKWARSVGEIQFQDNWMKRMPSFLKELYIVKNCPIKMKEVSLLGATGFEVILPITLEDVNRKSTRYIQKVIDRAMEILEENKVKIICFVEEGNDKFSYSIQKSNGNFAIPFLMYSAILRAVKTVKKQLKYVQITILDGRNKKTDFIVDLLYPHVNYLNIVSDEPDRFKRKSKEIYEDVGLNLQFLSHNKQTPLQGSDIIIDCTDKEHTDFYYCMKEAVYFYIGDNKEMVKDILLKRSDLMVVDDFILSFENKKVSTAFCEMIWFISKPWFDISVLGEYSLDDLKKITREIRKDGWAVEDFCQYGRIIK